MSKTTTNMADVARRLADSFEDAKRPDGSEFVRVRDGAQDAEALTEFLRDEIHDSARMLPNDVLFEETRRAFETIADHDGDTDSACEDVESDVYTSDLLDWLRTAPGAVEAVDDAAREFGYDLDAGIMGIIGLGQRMERERVIRSCGEFVERLADGA